MKSKIKYTIFLIFLFLGQKAFSQVNSKKSHKNSSITFEVTYGLHIPIPDTLTLYFCSHILNDRIEEEYSLKKNVALNNHRVITLSVPANEKGYISLVQHNKDRQNKILDMYFATPGDQIKLKIIKNEKNGRFASIAPVLTFSGNGYLKYKAQFEANWAGYSDTSSNFVHKLTTSMSVIKKYKSSLSPLESDILTLDQISHYGNMMEFMNTLFLEDHTIKDTTEYHYYKPLDLMGISDSAKLISKEYPSYVIKRASNGYKLYQRPGDADTAIYRQIIKSVATAHLRDKLITVLFVKWSFSLKNGNDILNDAVKRVKVPLYLEKLKSFEVRFPGRQAFDFKLVDTVGKEATLAQFKGKTIFLDLWFTGCDKCINFYQTELSKIEEHFKDDPNIVFISICADKDMGRWLNSISSDQYTSKSAVNLYTNGRGFNDPFMKYYQITGYPTAMIIDKNGKLFSSMQKDLRHKKTAIPILQKAMSIKQD